MAVSSPCTAPCASHGERTPPGGAPVALGKRWAPSMTPALSQARIVRLSAGKVGSWASHA